MPAWTRKYGSIDEAVMDKRMAEVDDAYVELAHREQA